MTTGYRNQPDNIPVIDKAPAAVLPYTEDWSSWLATGETISTAVWTVDPGITQNGVSSTTTSATIVLAGGTVGTTYLVSCTITTSLGNVDTRSFRAAVKVR